MYTLLAERFGMTAHKYAIQCLSDAVMSFQLEAIPADVLNLAKRSLVDVCGVTLAGAKTKSAKLLFRYSY